MGALPVLWRKRHKRRKVSRRAAWAALIFIFVIGIRFGGFYEPAHAVDGAGGWLKYAAECSPSNLTGFQWAVVGIFHEPKTTEKFCAGPDGFDSFVIQTPERTNVARAHRRAQPTFRIADIGSSRSSHVRRQSGVRVDDIEVHPDVGNDRLSVPYIRVNYIDSNGLIRTKGDKPYMLDSDFWPVGGNKFRSGKIDRRLHIAGLNDRSSASMPKLFFASSPEQDGRDAETDRGYGKPEREERYRIGRSPLPKGFALFTFGAAALGGIMTFLLLSIGRSISRLPPQYRGPEYRTNKESKNDFSSEPTPNPPQKSPHQKPPF